MNTEFQVITNHPVALDSRDHTKPHGTKQDNSGNRKFNQKLYVLLPETRPLRVLDVGCSGGKFVRDCIEDGHVAVGLEGSDYSLLNNRAEWATIPKNLFCCDVTRPFEITELGAPAYFDVATAWEVMEHIPEERLGQVCENIRRHLSPSGLWVMSVSTEVGYHHVTVKSKEWWASMFVANGFENDAAAVAHFGEDWVRGPKQGAPGSFHLVLKRR